MFKYTIYVSMYIPNTHLITINVTFSVNTYISGHRCFSPDFQCNNNKRFKNYNVYASDIKILQTYTDLM